MHLFIFLGANKIIICSSNEEGQVCVEDVLGILAFIYELMREMEFHGYVFV
jgi:hypothetical protein